MKLAYDIIYLLAVSVFLTVAGFVLHKYYSKVGESLSIAILAAVVGSIIMVGAMIILIGFQSRRDVEKQYKALLFEKKLTAYQNLLTYLFKIADDNIITKAEIQEFESKVGSASLVADTELLHNLAWFTWQFKSYGCLFESNMNDKQIEDFIRNWKMDDGKRPRNINKNNWKEWFVSLDELVQLMRLDLSIVASDLDKFPAIEYFISVPYNEKGLMSNPTTNSTQELNTGEKPK